MLHLFGVWCLLVVSYIRRFILLCLGLSRANWNWALLVGWHWMSKVKTAAVSISSNGSSTTSFFLDEWCEEHLHNFCILGVHALTGSCSLAQASFARYDGCCLPSTKLSLGVLYVHCILFTYHVQDDLHHVSDVLSSKTSSLLGTEENLVVLVESCIPTRERSMGWPWGGEFAEIVRRGWEFFHTLWRMTDTLLACVSCLFVSVKTVIMEAWQLGSKILTSY